MTVEHAIDEHFMSRYRELRDAEDAAFDELEHAYEDGDRPHFEKDYQDWKNAIQAKIAYLKKAHPDLLE